MYARRKAEAAKVLVAEVERGIIANPASGVKEVFMRSHAQAPIAMTSAGTARMIPMITPAPTAAGAVGGDGGVDGGGSSGGGVGGGGHEGGFTGGGG